MKSLILSWYCLCCFCTFSRKVNEKQPSFLILYLSQHLPNFFNFLQSMLNFMNDPTGEMPWEEEEGTEDVRHVHTSSVSCVV